MFSSFCPPKPGLIDIISTIKHFGKISSSTLTGVVKFNTTPALQPASFI